MKILNYLSSVKWPWLETQTFLGLQKKVVIISAIALSILLSGKFRCFGVISATFQNKTCSEIGRSCSQVMLNFIGVLGVAISLAGSPFVTGFFLATKSPALGGRICVHFTILVLIGCLATNFVIQPDSLIVTDSIIQGVGLSVLISILSIRITEIFPREHKYHVMVSAFTDAGPWGTIIICPIYGVITQVTEWQQNYLFFGVFLAILILITSLVEPRLDKRTLISVTRSPYVPKSHHPPKTSSTSSKCPDHPYEKCKSYQEVNEIELWGDDDSENTVYSVSSEDEHSVYSLGTTNVQAESSRQYPINSLGFQELFMSSDTKSIVNQPNAVLWLIDRAIHAMVQYGLVLNLVDYMVLAVHESLEKASLVMMSLGAGEVIGFVIATGLGDQLRHHLIHIYTISTGLLTCIFAGWHLTQRFHIARQFSNGDAHFLALMSGIVMAFCSSYTYSLAEDVINKPGIISYSLTRFCQAIGVVLVPLSAGLVINISKFNYFFLIQSIFTGLRFVLLCILVYRIRGQKKGEKMGENLKETIEIDDGDAAEQDNGEIKIDNQHVDQINHVSV